jgi:hypothetical protein
VNNDVFLTRRLYGSIGLRSGELVFKSIFDFGDNVQYLQYGSILLKPRPNLFTNCNNDIPEFSRCKK